MAPLVVDIDRLTLITGPSRGGKTSLALRLAASFPPPRAYLATAQALDDEMVLRIRRHQEERGGEYETVEEPLELVTALDRLNRRCTVVIIDCLTLWLSNLLGRWGDHEDMILEEARGIIRFLRDFPLPTLVISNEVGWGIVPENALARRFRDLSGKINQELAAAADRVILSVAGIPLVLKGPPL
ncbi:MAG: bifunctional adenosylcobinamide kinase/adenosylcobinamide-phosphate guanylyltransferase [Deltaproteobacteria bacterium]|nr:bifunctional adenosylcobinamide kinase/adenosylcobinamide-phosphate guanylyltransferase [Deltaproteobacteria bacterium]